MMIVETGAATQQKTKDGVGGDRDKKNKRESDAAVEERMPKVRRG